ncbi:putative phosphoglycerate mutase [Breznakia blatticola]|uniref:phosphoglycerate mutase (2,3-diphosphoglycerate-dependent) n=1 Tax=Breznakia blatticola TaxID=1754012 RepID=A0A4R7ZEW9_9FIRM|nr:histidine phosphatase family protein [Breznakia blatticola]TDW16183.1 putative phosphoglycerate mutase [Breznakia blatticola]
MGNKVTIYFIRHGETYLNKYKKMQGWSDAPLTQKGEEDAIATGKRLENEKFDVIYTSDLGRTIRTANLILAENTYRDETKIIPTYEFRETFYGSLDGSFCDYVYGKVAKNKNIEVRDIFTTLSLDEIALAIKDVDQANEAETQKEVESRLNKGLEMILNKHQDDSKLMVVTHGNVIRTIVHMVDETIPVKQELKNSGVTTITYENGVGKVVAFNE